MPYKKDTTKHAKSLVGSKMRKPDIIKNSEIKKSKSSGESAAKE